MKKLILYLFLILFYSNLNAQEFGDTKEQALQKIKNKGQLNWWEEDRSGNLRSFGRNGNMMSLGFKNNRLWHREVLEKTKGLFNAKEILYNEMKNMKSEGWNVYKSDLSDVKDGGITAKRGNFRSDIAIQYIDNEFYVWYNHFWDIFN